MNTIKWAIKNKLFGECVDDNYVINGHLANNKFKEFGINEYSIKLTMDYYKALTLIDVFDETYVYTASNIDTMDLYFKDEYDAIVFKLKYL